MFLRGRGAAVAASGMINQVLRSDGANELQYVGLKQFVGQIQSIVSSIAPPLRLSIIPVISSSDGRYKPRLTRSRRTIIS